MGNDLRLASTLCIACYVWAMSRAWLVVLVFASIAWVTSSRAVAEDVPLESLPGVRLRAAFALAIAGSGDVSLRGDGPGGLVGFFTGSSGLAVGGEARGGWFHRSGFGLELRVGAAGLSLLERSRRALSPPEADVDSAVFVEAGPMFSYGRALPLERVALELRLEGGAAWAKVLGESMMGITLHVGAELNVFVTHRFAISAAAAYRWLELLEPDRLKGGEVYVRLGPTVRFPL